MLYKYFSLIMPIPLDELDPQHFMTGEYLFNDVKFYAAFGDHRAATPADRKTSEWLRQQLEGFGFDATLHPFPIRQFFLEKSRVEVAGREIPAFPLWPPTPADLPDTPFTITRFPAAWALLKDHRAILDPLIASGAKAILAITPSPTGELVMLNIPAATKPWPIPILLVGERHESALKQASRASIRIAGRDDPHAQAFDTVGTIGMGKKHFVISTPSSGWFRCAAERGCGIALWLALARWSSHRESQARFTFVASSAHEFTYAGLRQFFRGAAPKPHEVDAWIHLGASIAAISADRKLTTNRREWLPLLQKNFANIEDLKPDAPPDEKGELGEIFQQNYRTFGLAGTHPYFHSPSDLPDRTTPQLLSPVGEALLRTIHDLESAAANFA